MMLSRTTYVEIQFHFGQTSLLGELALFLSYAHFLAHEDVI